MPQIIRGLPSARHRMDCAVAIGNFDGAHLGHQALLREVVEAAHMRALQPAVLTFEPHPKEFFGTAPLSRISTLRDKYRAILDCGIERIYVMGFNEALASLTPVDFCRDILSEGLAARYVSVGKNFRFGANCSGSFDTLKELGRHYGFETFDTPLLHHGQVRISSSRIRAALALGDLEEAALMLGRRYGVTARVVHGAELGRTIGFPTLNQRLVPSGSHSGFALKGVYAVLIRGLDNSLHTGVASLGTKPTVSGAGVVNLETHVFDWKGNAYGRIVHVDFVAKLRDEKKFSGLEELTAAIAHDAEEARRILGIAHAL